jgi:hypothetical protein
MLNKKFKVITLSNGKKKLTIVFSDEEYKLLSTFFFVEVNSFEDWIKENIDDVLQGKNDRREISGNICELIIEKDKTIIYDMLAEDGMGKWCSVSTKELLSIINEWHEQKLLLD